MDVFSDRNPVAPNKKELWGGLICFIAYLILIPVALSLLPWFSDDSTQTLFLYNLAVTVCDLVVVLFVFRDFLFRSKVPFGILIVTCLFGFLGGQALDRVWGGILGFLQTTFPETPVNMNQDNLVEFFDSYGGYMIIYTAVLIPFVEEILFRGVIFAPLCQKRPFWAYVASMSAFAFMHVLSFVGAQPWWMLLYSFLQYLPAGFVLCWSYQRSRSILTPIALHGLMNLYSSVTLLLWME